MIRFSPALAFAVLATPASAETDHAYIDREVARFAGAQIGEQGGARHPVDRRLRLAPCSQALALAWYGSARESVLVRCPDPQGWRIFVPVVPAASVQPVKLEPAIERGEAVAIVVQGRGFSLSRQGEALDQGAVGEWIRVRPAGRKRAEPMRAQILRPGTVGMRLP